MALDKPPAAPSMISNALWFTVFFVGLFLLWLIFIGPDDPRSQSGILINPPAPLGDGAQYGDVPGIDSERLSDGPRSLSFGHVRLGDQEGGSRSVNPQNEYLIISLEATAPKNVVLTNFQIVGSEGETMTIPRGAPRFVQGKISTAEPIVMAPGDVAILVSGVSPLGVSFRLNACSGYLEQFQDFTPPLRATCPSPVDFSSNTSVTPDQSCVQFAASMPTCTVPIALETPGLKEQSSSCRQYLDERASYNGCVEAHKGDGNFDGREWRIYLGSASELWQKGEVIELRDESGLIVDTLQLAE